MSTYSPFVAALHVFIGGGAGAVLRWQLGRAMTGWLGAPIVTAFPFATLAANAAAAPPKKKRPWPSASSPAARAT